MQVSPVKIKSTIADLDDTYAAAPKLRRVVVMAK